MGRGVFRGGWGPNVSIPGILGTGTLWSDELAGDFFKPSLRISRETARTSGENVDKIS